MGPGLRCRVCTSGFWRLSACLTPAQPCSSAALLSFPAQGPGAGPWMRCMPYALCPQNMPMLCPPEYMVCFLHRLISALRCCWDEYKGANPHASFSEGE